KCFLSTSFRLVPLAIIFLACEPVCELSAAFLLGSMSTDSRTMFCATTTLLRGFMLLVVCWLKDLGEAFSRPLPSNKLDARHDEHTARVPVLNDTVEDIGRTNGREILWDVVRLKAYTHGVTLTWKRGCCPVDRIRYSESTRVVRVAIDLRNAGR